MLLVFFFLLTDPASPYNVDTLDPVVLTPPSPGQHFGYSVAIQTTSLQGWLLVGAPTANFTLPDQSKGVEWGAVYNCSMGNHEAGEAVCRQVVLDTTHPGPHEEKQGQWTGVTLSVDRESADAVTCAHRFTRRGIMNTGNEIGMRGKCWFIKSSGKTEEIPELCHSQILKDCDRCSAGFSAAFTDKDFVAIGGVGYQNWMGRSMFYDAAKNNVPLSNKVITGRYSRTYDYYGYSSASCYDKQDRWTYLFVGAPRSSIVRGKVDYIKYLQSVKNGIISSSLAKGHQIGAYFGASVTCGYTRANILQIIIGAPFHSEMDIAGDYDRGKIYIYQVNKYAVGKPSFPQGHIIGPAPGSRFGAVVSVLGDINKDGLDDLAVGAPADREPDTGRVYIYLGQPNGLNTYSKPVQVIAPLKRPGAPLFGFGTSISGDRGDVDHNGYPDLVVGAPHSDKAFLFRTVPIINLDINQTLPNLTDNLVDKNDPCPNETVACFTLQYCVKYVPEPDQKIDSSRGFSIRVTNRLDTENDEMNKRVRFSNEKTYVVYENFTDYVYGSEKEKCGEQKIFLEETITNIAQLINIKTEAAVLPSPQFHNRLALNVSRYSYTVSQVKIKTACANATCETDLRLESSRVQLDKHDNGTRVDVLYPGFNQLIWSNYSITRNTSLGKPFGSHLIVTMPASMYIKAVRDQAGTRISICTPFSVKEGCYYCALNQRLDNSSVIQFNFSVEYSVTAVHAEDAKEVTIQTELVTEGSEDMHPENNVLTQSLAVRRLARLQLQGTASPARLVFQVQAFRGLCFVGARTRFAFHFQIWNVKRPVREENAKVNFVSDISTTALETTFLPINHGPGDLEELQLLMEVPFGMNSTEPLDFIYPYKVTSDTAELECNQDLLNVHNIAPDMTPQRRTRSLPPRSLMGEVHGSLRGTPSNEPPPQVSYQCGGWVHCANVTCTVRRLTKDMVGIRLTSYVWEPTFRDPVRINTSIRAWVANKDPDTDLSSLSFTGPVVLPLKVIAVADLVKPVSIWVLVGSISGGLCFLALIVIILHKVGFFNRKRPPAEFYGKENPAATIEVVDDSHDAVEPYQSDSEDEENQFAFKNPLCDELNM